WARMPMRWAMRSRPCWPTMRVARRWPLRAWSWWSRAAARWRGRWRWWVATCRVRARSPDAENPGFPGFFPRCRRLLHLRRLRLRGRFLRQLRVGVHGEQAVDVLHVVVVQRAGGLLQQQPVLQVVVLGDGVGLARVEQVLLVDQHVQHGAGADLQADLRGVVGGLGRNHRQAPRLDLGDAGHQGLVGVAGVALDRALLLLELVAADVAVGDRFAHARL